MERYKEKIESGKVIELPLHLACVNFGKEPNVAHAYRTASCFGAKAIHLIGSCDMEHGKLRAISGSTQSLTPMHKYRNPSEFVEFSRKNNLKILSFEMPDDSFGMKVHNFYEYEFDFENDQEWILATGGESIGIPIEVLINSDVVYVPNRGKSYCLNTSQVLNMATNEFNRQYYNYQKRNR